MAHLVDIYGSLWIVMVSSGRREICDMNRAKSLEGILPFPAPLRWDIPDSYRRDVVDIGGPRTSLNANPRPKHPILLFDMLTYTLDRTGMYVLDCLSQRKFN